MLGILKGDHYYAPSEASSVSDFMQDNLLQLQTSIKYDTEVPKILFNECIYYLSKGLLAHRSALQLYQAGDQQFSVVCGYYAAFLSMVSFTRYAGQPISRAGGSIYRLDEVPGKPFSYKAASLGSGSDFHQRMWRGSQAIVVGLLQNGRPAPDPAFFEPALSTFRNRVNYAAFNVLGELDRKVEPDLRRLLLRNKSCLDDYVFRLLSEADGTTWAPFLKALLQRVAMRFTGPGVLVSSPAVSGFVPDFEMLLGG